jgi:dUTP pyrophosphatase
MYTLDLLPSEGNTFYADKQLSKDNAGFDLYVPEDVVFAAGEKKLVSMKVRARLTQELCVCNGFLKGAANYWMIPRSSISKTGLMLCNSVGVIDRSYRGELMAYLWNTRDEPVSVSKGDRLIQIVAPDMGWISSVHVVDELDSTERGEGGFGSTGR